VRLGRGDYVVKRKSQEGKVAKTPEHSKKGSPLDGKEDANVHRAGGGGMPHHLYYPKKKGTVRNGEIRNMTT